MISNISTKINLRPVERDDLFTIQRWRNKKEIQPFVREYRELSLTHLTKWLESQILSDKFEFFLIEDERGTPIGVTGLTYIDWVSKNADLHLAIYEKEWIDEVYAPEVRDVMLDYGFNQLNLHRIYAEVYEIDRKKVKFFSDSNFKLDATLREHHYCNGEYINSHIYSLLKTEYERY